MRRSVERRPPEPRHVALLFSLYYLAFYLCRYSVLPTAPLMAREWGLSHEELGVSLSLLYAGYSLMLLPAGFLAGSFGASRALVLSAACTAAVNLAIPLAREHLTLSALLLANGMAQALAWPSLMQLTAARLGKDADYALGLALGARPSVSALALNLAGVFLGYAVGYSCLWVYFKGVREALATVATGFLVLGYQRLVNQALLGKVTTVLQSTALSGVVAIVVAGSLKKMLSEFTKKAVERPPRKPPSRAEELRALLEKLDRALIEGRISEETYRELKEKYEKELKALEGKA